MSRRFRDGLLNALIVLNKPIIAKAFAIVHKEKRFAMMLPQDARMTYCWRRCGTETFVRHSRRR